MCSFLVDKKLNIFHLSQPGKTRWDTDLKKGVTVIKQIKRPRLLTFTSEPELMDLSHISQFDFDPQINSLLISNLQKSIRRNLPRAAISTACELIKYKQGATQLLRRLCIIILEDKFCCYDRIAEHYNTLVWMMATGWGWNGWQEWILGLIHYICSQDFEYIPKKEANKLAWSDNPYACCFLLRMFYGGMAGDMKMLAGAAHLVEKADPRQLKRNTVKLELKQPVHKLEVIPSAVDFHCASSILKNVAKRNPSYRQNQIKQAIWIYSSSIRFNCARQKDSQVWVDIQDDVISFQNWYLKNIIFSRDTNKCKDIPSCH